MQELVKHRRVSVVTRTSFLLQLQAALSCRFKSSLANKITVSAVYGGLRKHSREHLVPRCSFNSIYIIIAVVNAFIVRPRDSNIEAN